MKKFNGIKEVSIILGSLILLIVACVYLFQDSDLEIIEQKLTESNLNDNFKVLNKIDNQTLIDYHIDYEILISEEDKLNLVNKIRNSKKFKKKKTNQEEYSSYWKNEHEKEVVENQIVIDYNIDQFYLRTITFPNSSQKLEIEIDTIKNELRITDSAD